MTGRVQGKVAVITGAARGQGRSHAVRLAEEGADIIALDLLNDVDDVPYGMATTVDLDQTIKAVEALDRRIVAGQVDVRDLDRLKSVIDNGVRELGRLDVVCANAGVCTSQPWGEVSSRIWQTTLDINLTGAWNTVAASIPHLINAGGGSIIATSSAAGLKGMPFLLPYVASKFGVVGLIQGLANELAKYNIRANTIHPCGVDTSLNDGIGIHSLIERDSQLSGIFMNSLPVEVIDPRDVSNVVLFLASDESRFITGLKMTVDAGNTAR